jgi:hypothetical protein
MRLRTIRAAVAATALVFASAAPALAQYPKSDTPTITVTFNAATSTTLASRTFTIVIPGYAPFSFVVLDIQSDPVNLGRFQADANGVVTAEVTIPEGIPAGDHHLVASGTDAAGKPLVQRQAVVLAETVSAPSSLSLTGSDAQGIAAVGGVLLVMGAAATIATRRRLSAQD